MEKGSIAANSRAPQPSPPPPLPPAKDRPPAAEILSSSRRQMFTVELKPGGTTIVSWKKLLKEAGMATRKSSADPAVTDSNAASASVASVLPTEGDIQDAPPASRFSAVIEKIERLYMGEQSSDEEELDDIPDDQYDTEDSFIDDTELDEYFQVDKLSTKHNGYFVNRGNLEKMESSSPPNLAPKKKRRKDSSKVHSENKREHILNEPVNTDSMQIKAAARSAPLNGKKSSIPAKSRTNFSEHYEEGKVLKNKANTSTGTYKERSAKFTSNMENPSSLRTGKDVASLALESRGLYKHKASRDRNISCLQVGSQAKKSMNGEKKATLSTKVCRNERYGISTFPDSNSARSAYPMQAIQTSSTQVKEGSVMRPIGTRLERAIRDLEKIVALCRPPRLDIHEDTSQVVKRRIPQEVKQKLARVARLSANQHKITEDDLIDRLMGIVGHLVQRKTLKRNIRDMVVLDLSAKQQKDERFQQIKQEVNEMIQARVSLLKPEVAEQPNGLADVFRKANGNEDMKAANKYMDTALEDKICDLYDLYVEGMDEEKGPQSRKLYVELAELWPNGYMNNYGIKDAIFRSKERKKANISRNKVRDEERIKRKKMAMAGKVEPSPTAQVQSRQERPIDSSHRVLLSPGKLMPNQSVASSGRMPEAALPSTDAGPHHVSKNHDKARPSSSANAAADNRIKMVLPEAKKKIKRKAESDLDEIHRRPAKLLSQDGKSKHGPHKDETNAGHQPKLLNLQLPVAPAPSSS